MVAEAFVFAAAGGGGAMASRCFTYSTIRRKRLFKAFAICRRSEKADQTQRLFCCARTPFSIATVHERVERFCYTIRQMYRERVRVENEEKAAQKRERTMVLYAYIFNPATYACCPVAHVLFSWCR